MSVRNPHDTFRQMFAQPEVAADFLHNYLPPAVRDQLDLSTVELQQDSFVDDELREHFADLLFHVSLHNGDIAFVYALLEHKSQPEPLVAFQLLRYMVRIWERSQRDEGALPLIIPIVVYHGEQKWRVPHSFSELFTGPEALRGYWPDFAYALTDLSAYSDDELRGEVVLRVALLALKTIFARDAANRLPGILTLLRRGLTDEQRALEYLQTVLLYLGRNQYLEEDDLRAAIATALADEEEGSAFMSIAEKWEAKGREQGIELGVEQGREEGREEGREAARAMVFSLLNHQFESLPQSIVQKLYNCSLDQLRALHNPFLEATSLAQVEQYLDGVADGGDKRD